MEHQGLSAAKWIEKVSKEKKKLCSGPTRASKSGQKSRAQRTYHGRTSFIFTTWVSICLNFNSRQGQSLCSSLCLPCLCTLWPVCVDRHGEAPSPVGDEASAAISPWGAGSLQCHVTHAISWSHIVSWLQNKLIILKQITELAESRGSAEQLVTE